MHKYTKPMEFLHKYTFLTSVGRWPPRPVLQDENTNKGSSGIWSDRNIWQGFNKNIKNLMFVNYYNIIYYIVICLMFFMFIALFWAKCSLLHQ